jgi:molybdopterin molybdotransferase
LIGFPEARATILQNTETLQPEQVGYKGFFGRICAEAFATEIDLPPFDNSQVDGYAVRSEGSGARKIVGESAAGNPWLGRLESGQTVRIFTGAAIPEGADAVAMQEDARVLDGALVEFDTAIEAGDFVRRRGEDIPLGTEIDLRGKLLTPPMIGLITSLGTKELRVGGEPRVTVFSTGDELREVGAELGPGQIFESNHWAVGSAVKGLGMPCKGAHIPDSLEALKARFDEALAGSDVLITTGGVSVGDHDHVRLALSEIGVREIFWRVAMKPGKPFFFGKKDEKLVFGLPGNPVSALVTFQLLVRPALLKLRGLSDHEIETTARLAAPVQRKDLRYEFLRANLAGGVVTPVLGQGSHIQTGLTFANALIHLPEGESEFAEGAEVQVTPLDWGL